MTAPNSKRMISQWNHHCIKCHSTAGNPGLVKETTVRHALAELGISCEACHGPAAEHADHYRSPLARYKEQFSDAPAAKVVNPATRQARSQTLQPNLRPVPRRLHLPR